MSKHKTTEQKLHVSKEISDIPPHKSDKLAQKVKVPPAAPPKGTNANNQYR